MGTRNPGPMCSTLCGPGWIDDGTMCLNKTYSWGPLRSDSPKRPLERCGRSVPIDVLLQEGAEKLERIRFGNPLRIGVFDTQYWEARTWTIKDLSDDVLVLRAGIRPSEAIDALFAKPGSWGLDCAMFVQALLLYCLLQRLPPSQFDEQVERMKKTTGGVVMLRQHLSTGLVVKNLRDFPPIFRSSYKAGDSIASLKALNAAPIGSVVVFTNTDAPVESGYRHENTIKLEPDLFIAHGVHKGSAFAARDAIERKLMNVALKYNPELANVRQVVSVTWICQYQLS